MLTIAADPKHLGARIGITAVLHTWGSAMTHHPHVHMIVPGGGIAPDGSRWISSRPAFLLPVRVLGKLFRRLFLTRLDALHDAGRLAFFGSAAHLIGRRAFLRHLTPVRNKRWVVYAKPPFAGPASGARLPVALHSPGRHLEPPPDRLRRGRSHLPLQGLSPRWCRAPARHDARSRRVHPPLPAPRPAAWASTASVTMGCSPAPPARPASHSRANCWTSLRRPKTTLRKNRLTSARHALAAADAWSSSRGSNGGSQPRAPPASERPTGRTPHDPAWPSCSYDRATPAPVNGMLCARCRGAGRHAHQSRRNQRYRLCDLARKPLPRHAYRILCGSSRQALAHPEAQIPIGNRLRPAGSCMRDFRTPDGTRNP